MWFPALQYLYVPPLPGPLRTYTNTRVRLDRRLTLVGVQVSILQRAICGHHPHGDWRSDESQNDVRIPPRDLAERLPADAPSPLPASTHLRCMH
jgi:hypothetical protein